jgi:glycosyltransferase involved in cell wall biosynthesis
VAFSRNLGISGTDADFIVCLDADDYLAPEYVATLAAAMEQDRSLGVAYAGLTIHFPDGSEHPNPWPPAFDFDGMVKPTNPPSNCVPCAAMFRRSMWERAGGYLQSHAPAEDTEFFLRGLSTGFNGLKVTDEPLFHYRTHEGSASKTKQYKPIDTWHPWMHDYLYPMAAPVAKQPPVRSYSQPIISVIIPVGPGHAKFLPDALNSLLGQTFREWEAIVVDDTRRKVSKAMF